MAIGPGKYDDLCSLVREKAKAKGALVIVIAGDRGGGFSCQFDDMAMMEMVPDVLEMVAAQIRKDGVFAS
jgi:NAD(P)H-dependent flavin oxidoreductase YrpB (nitropropane dioxygenase family)